MNRQEEIREELGEMLRPIVSGSWYTFEAGRILKYLHSQGCVLKGDRELPEIPTEINYVGAYHTAQMAMLKAGYSAFVPLID